MSHNDSLISSNNSSFQGANDYKDLLEENNKLRKELEKFRALDIDIQKIIMIQKELISLKKFNQSENIDLEDFAKSVERAVEKSFGIKKSGLKERSQRIISMIFSLYENEAKWDFSKEKNENKGEEKAKQHFVFAQKIKQEVKQEMKQEVKSEEFSKKIYSKSQFIEDDKTQKKPAYDKFNKIQKDSKEKVEEVPSNNFQNDKTQKKEWINQQIPKGNKSIPVQNRQRELVQKEEKSYNKDELDQSKLPEIKQKQEIIFPINWQQKSYFKVDSGLIRKMINDDYRKIRASNPFPKFGQHTVRFQMVRQGTVAFGIVTDQYKDGIFIDDRKVDAIKYLSFYNGGGKLSMNGLELSQGRRLHLRQSQIIEITFDADRLQVKYSNKNLQKPIVIELQNAFKSRSLYFFIQMKTLSTTIRVL